MTIRAIVHEMLGRVLEAQPALRRIAESDTMGGYIESAFAWNPPRTCFPYRQKLREIIVQEVGRIHGQSATRQASKTLEQAWIVETGGHLHLPRRFDRVANKEGSQDNALVFQGQVLWVAANAKKDLTSISLSSGRIPINNPNSGCYLDYAPDAEPIRLVSNRYKETPECLIPALDGEEIERIKRQAGESAVAEQVLTMMRMPAVGFSDQIARGHSAFMSLILPPGVEHLTVDSEHVGKLFLQHLFADPDSALFRIFSSEELRNRLLADLAGISTGWKKGQAPFHKLEPDRVPPKFVEYDGDLTPNELCDRLTSGMIWAKGPLKFLGFMADGGLCSLGGMFQAGYCTKIRDTAVRLLGELGEKNRAEALTAMPTYMALMTPAWGVQGTQDRLVGALDFIRRPLTRTDLNAIMGISGASALGLATPGLARLLLNEKFDISVMALAQELGDVLVI